MKKMGRRRLPILASFFAIQLLLILEAGLLLNLALTAFVAVVAISASAALIWLTAPRRIS